MHDTILTERFRRSLTYEEVYSTADVSPCGACLGIGCSIARSHTERPHQALA